MTRLSRRIFVLSGLAAAGVAVTPRQGARAALMSADELRRLKARGTPTH
ncbi:hypothetical protein O7631_14690 [Micromonospora sp. WMMD967]|nr:hypothetical protein [Micromonospora sp. WMMD967]MDG4837765.1 hypothetical protein [Micromonospora sp. WMMD967]